MKNVIISTLVFVCGFNTNMNSQDLAGSRIVRLPSRQNAALQFDSGTTARAGFSKELRRNEINSKALRNFLKQHQKVENAKWFNAGGELIMVSFTFNGILHWIHYNNIGDHEFTIRFLNENTLPREVRHLIKSNYYDFDITDVREITRKDKIAFVVNVKDQTGWKIIKVVDGELELVETILKRPPKDTQ